MIAHSQLMVGMLILFYFVKYTVLPTETPRSAQPFQYEEAAGQIVSFTFQSLKSGDNQFNFAFSPFRATSRRLK